MLMEILKKEFNLNEGPFVKGIEESLDAIGVHRQKYYGGIFVGNHVHKILQVRLCYRCMSGQIYCLHSHLMWRSCALQYSIQHIP